MVALIYLAISYPATWLVAWLERRFMIGRPKADRHPGLFGKIRSAKL
jgi:hypothetical protein